MLFRSEKVVTVVGVQKVAVEVAVEDLAQLHKVFQQQLPDKDQQQVAVLLLDQVLIQLMVVMDQM